MRAWPRRFLPTLPSLLSRCSSLFRQRTGAIAFQPRDLLLSRVEIPLELRDATDQQLDAATMPLPVIPEIRLRRRALRLLPTRPEVSEELPRDRPRDGDEGDKENEKAEAECRASQDIDQIHGSRSSTNAVQCMFLTMSTTKWSAHSGNESIETKPIRANMEPSQCSRSSRALTVMVRTSSHVANP